MRGAGDMTQYAVVQRLTGDSKAEVEVMRGTSCGENCSSCGLCKCNSKMRVEAGNGLCAEPGDRVEIETKTSRIMGAAVLVYVLPFVLFFIGYGLAVLLEMTQGMSILMSFIFLAAGLGLAVVVARIRSKKPITYEITKIIEHEAGL